jgi:hypothetical protein
MARKLMLKNGHSQCIDLKNDWTDTLGYCAKSRSQKHIDRTKD